MTEHADKRRRRAVALRVATLGAVVREALWRSAESARRESAQEFDLSERVLEQLVVSRAASSVAGENVNLDRWTWSLVAEDHASSVLVQRAAELQVAEHHADEARSELSAAKRRVDLSASRHSEAKRIDAHHVEMKRLDSTLDLLSARRDS